MSGNSGDLFSINTEASKGEVFALEFTLRIRSGPGATRFTGPSGGALGVQVAAPPSSERANAECRALLASALGVTEEDLTLLSGGEGTVKVFGANLADLDAVRRSIATALEEAATLHSAPRTRRTR
jgi:uncharacterized protein YggU (UPF0235/DUF167 family)